MKINSFGGRKYTLAAAFFFLIFMLPVSVFADQRIDSVCESAVRDGLSEGVVILIRQNGNNLYLNACGTAEKSSVFDLASLTKVYAATLAVMRLTDMGLLDPSDKISSFFPQYSEGDKAGVTIEDLLRHRSGLPAWEPLYCFDEPATHLLNIPLEYKTGVKRVYSDLGFMIIGLIVENVSGTKLEKFVDDEFYKPLGLKSTGFFPDSVNVMPTFFGGFEADMIENDACRIKQKEEVLKGRVNDGNARMAFGGAAGHAGLFSTAEELAALTEMLTDGRHIKPETLKRFLTKDASEQGMGFAMTSGSLHAGNISEQTFGHLGFTGTSAVYVPEKKLTVIILTNRQMKGMNDKGRYPDLKEFRRTVFRNALRLADENMLK
jgi:CubicO group peptidase (beta-lactamase class C family)